jgi:fructose-specific phosphotransferase system IIC component
MLTIILFPLHILLGFIAGIIVYYQIKQHLFDDGRRNVLWWIFSIFFFPIIVSFGYISFVLAIWSKIASWLR